VGEDRTGRPGPTGQPTDHATGQAPGRRLTVPDAAAALGISADAVRSRIKRDTLETVREGGRVFVVLGGPDRAQPTNQATATDQPTEGYNPGPQEDRTAELIATLREQLQAERQAHAEARRLLMAALERIPALEAPPRDAPGAPTAGEDEPGGVETPGDRERPAQRPWWRRLFGG